MRLQLNEIYFLFLLPPQPPSHSSHSSSRWSFFSLQRREFFISFFAVLIWPSAKSTRTRARAQAHTRHREPQKRWKMKVNQCDDPLFADALFSAINQFNAWQSTFQLHLVRVDISINSFGLRSSVSMRADYRNWTKYNGKRANWFITKNDSSNRRSALDERVLVRSNVPIQINTLSVCAHCTRLDHLPLGRFN